jgi:histone deacetylase 1/2
MDNANSSEYLERIKNQVIENIRQSAHAPSVQQQDVPRDPDGYDDEADAVMDDLDEDDNKDVRYTRHRWDRRTEHDGELEESEDDEEATRNGVRRSGRKRMNIMDYQNKYAVPDDQEAPSAEEREIQQSDGPTETVEANGSARPAATSPNRDSGPATQVDESGDTEMAEAAPEPAAIAATTGLQGATPPTSPPRETATTSSGPNADQSHVEEAAEGAAQDEGVRDRQEADAVGQQATATAMEEDEL